MTISQAMKIGIKVRAALWEKGFSPVSFEVQQGPLALLIVTKIGKDRAGVKFPLDKVEEDSAEDIVTNIVEAMKKRRRAI